MPSRRSSLDDSFDSGNSYELASIKPSSKQRHEKPGDSTFDDDHVRSSDESDASIESFELYTPDEERAVLRKLDIHIVLFMSFLYLLSFLDRSNIGNAKIAGLIEDLNLTDDQFEWLLTGLWVLPDKNLAKLADLRSYITYILFEWMILLYHVLPPRIYIAVTVFSWGILASMQSLATNFSHMLILRLLLGISEAAFSPGVPYYLSFFYRREELALRAGIQVSAAPLAASFAGSLAWLITKLGEKGPLAPWRLLFLVEGFPSVIVAVIAWKVVPDNLETAWFLTPRERHIAMTRLERARGESAPKQNAAKRDPTVRTKKIDWKQIWTTIRDPKCYLTALMFMNCNIAFSSMPVFLPTVVHQLGFTSLASQALSAPPFLLSFAVVIGTALASDRARQRTPFLLAHAALASASYALAAVAGVAAWPALLSYFAVYGACAGFFSAITLLITLTLNNAESESGRGAGMTLLNIFGQTGPLLGTRLYPDADAPRYVRGMAACAGAMAVVLAVAAAYRWVLVRENRKRARVGLEYEALDAQDDEGVPLAAEGEAPRAARRKPFLFML